MSRVDRAGIYLRYQDAGGRWRKAQPRTCKVIQAAMGDAGVGAAASDAVRVVRAGCSARIEGAARLVLEDHTELTLNGRLPRDLPIGYHDLELRGRSGPPIRLIVRPDACFVPGGPPAWGWSVQLYALRSRRSWGIGDLADLHDFARMASRQGAAWILINPLGAGAPVPPQQPSPYYPSSRVYRHPLYLSIDAVPGADRFREQLSRVAIAGHALNRERDLDRDAAFTAKMTALGRLWRARRPSASFEHYVAGQGEPLNRFAEYCALAELHGADWRRWPAPYRRPGEGGVQRFAAAHADRIRFHQWLQWLLDEQLKRAGRCIGLITDFPVGMDPAGADAWIWQDVLASGVKAGAPPDDFNPQGQNWGLQPFAPARLRAARYEPFVLGVRSAMRHARGLRIDHVMGLFRLYWIPRGRSAREGTYVAYPAEDLLAVLAVESHRAGAVVIGEDLGTVEAGVRRKLARWGILGCRVMWFELRPPATYPVLALASVSTHDLPTVAGFWSGHDARKRSELGFSVHEPDIKRIRRRICRITGVQPHADIGSVIEAMHRALAQSPALIRLATLEDALAVPDRPNMPGTTTEYPNWSQALPVPLERLTRQSGFRSVAAAMSRLPGGSRR